MFTCKSMDDDVEKDLYTLESSMHDNRCEGTSDNYWPKAEIYYWPKAEIYGQEGGAIIYSDSLNDCTPEDIIHICESILEERKNG